MIQGLQQQGRRLIAVILPKSLPALHQRQHGVACRRHQWPKCNQEHRQPARLSGLGRQRLDPTRRLCRGHTVDHPLLLPVATSCCALQLQVERSGGKTSRCDRGVGYRPVSDATAATPAATVPPIDRGAPHQRDVRGRCVRADSAAHRTPRAAPRVPSSERHPPERDAERHPEGPAGGRRSDRVRGPSAPNAARGTAASVPRSAGSMMSTCVHTHPGRGISGAGQVIDHA